MKSKRCRLFICFALALTVFAGARFAAAADDLFEELVTVTEDGFGVAWETAESGPTVLYYGDSPNDLQPWDDTGAPPSRHHLVVVTGLASDTLYYYSTTAPRRETVDNPFSPGQVRTLKTPPGEYLFSFATVNDTHVGETVAGLIVIGDFSLTPGFTWPDPNNPYWLFTNEQAVQQINALGADFVIHKGDVSSEAEEQQFIDAQTIFSALDAPIYYARGNHDRPQDDHDYFEEVLGITVTHSYFDHDPLRLIIMDTNDPLGLGDPADDQLAWLKTVLDDAQAQGLRAMIFAHQTFALKGGFPWSVDPADAKALAELLTNYPNFVGMFAGHSHRAKVNYVDQTAWVPYVETPATKEYPLGFAYYRVYEGGYVQSFYREACEDCLEWCSMTRGEYFGLAPWIMFGKTEDRNFTVIYPDDDTADDDSTPDDDNTSDDDAASDDDTIDDDATAPSGDNGDNSGCGC